MMHENIDRVLYSEQDIAQRVAEMGEEITRDYAGRATLENGIVMIAVLRGAAIFMADLARAVKLPIEMEYMAISSYGSGSHSSGVVRILKDISTDIEGRHVIIAEDVLDTGLTLKYLLRNLASRNPASIEVATLLHKSVPGQADIPVRYLGFEAPNEFLVGYGLDYAERYRNLPYIGVLKSDQYQ